MRTMRKPASAVMTLIGINVAVYLLQFIILSITGRSGYEVFIDMFALQQGDLLNVPYTLLTSMFMHSLSPAHIFINMFVLYMFGSLLEQKIGSKRFLLIYFLSGLLAAAVSSLIYDTALGASGAVMGIVGVVIMLLPNLMVLFFFVVPMPLWIAGIVIAFIEVFGAFGTGTTANVAHLIGMGTGLAYGYYLKKSSKKFRRKMQGKSHLTPEDMEDYIKNGRI